MYYIQIRALTTDNTPTKKSYYYVDGVHMAEKVEDATMWKTREEADRTILIWTNIHPETADSFVLKSVKYREYTAPVREEQEEEPAVAVAPIVIPEPTTISAEKQEPVQVIVKNKCHCFWSGLLVALVLLLTMGGLFHHVMKPAISNMTTLLSSIEDGKDGDQGIQGIQGEKGEDGIGITSIAKTDSSGLVDTYTITYSDGSTSTFTVTNGSKGETGDQGIQGETGLSGSMPSITIGENGNWYINGVDTGKLASVNSALTPSNPLYEYELYGNCETGGYETYTDENGNSITTYFGPGEHRWDDESHTCLRDCAKVFKTDNYDMAVCGTTACFWPTEDSNGRITKDDISSFNELFSVLGCTVETVIIKDGITQIGNEVFKDCESIKEVIFESDITKIGNYAFYNTGITDIELPGSIQSVGVLALNPDELETLTISEYTSTNPNYQAKIDLNPKTIDSYHTYGEQYTALREVTFNTDVYLPSQAFRGCSAIETVTFTGDNNYISGWAFQGCTSLTDIDLTGVTYIGEVAFQCCESLTEIYIPSSVAGIGKWAFDGAYNLRDIYMDVESEPETWSQWCGTIDRIYTTSNSEYNPKIPTASTPTLSYTHACGIYRFHWGVTAENPDGNIEEVQWAAA